MAYQPDRDELASETLTRACQELAQQGLDRKAIVFALANAAATLARHTPDQAQIATVLRGAAAIIEQDIASPREIN